MKKVFKYPAAQQIELPAGAEIIHAGMDGQLMPCVWAIVDPDIQERETVKLHCIWTGVEIPPQATRYLGTYISPGGLVWHVFAEEVQP